jgi:hypothetical protein
LTLDQRAKTAREELFRRYDALNALWLKAEEDISKLHIPHDVEYPYQTYDIIEQKPDSYLAVVKIKGKWRICQGTYRDWCEAGPAEWTPIVECSAAIRVYCAKYLPALREAVIKAAESFIPKVDAAIEKLSDALGVRDGLAMLLAERAKLNGKK